jgi:hypothetical protein
MSKNYAVALPHDQSGEVNQNSPAPYLAKDEWHSENASASSVISLTHDTTVVEVGANNGPAAIKWIATTDTTASVVTAAATADFDHVIPTGTVRRFVIPIETAVTNPQSIQGINRLNGLYQRIAYKSFGIASITMTEH